MIVVDASVAVKWLVEDEASDDADAVLAAPDLAAPEHILFEVANALWAKVRRRTMTQAQADLAYAQFRQAPVTLTTLREIADSARAMSFQLDRTVYDAAYPALAQKLGAQLATADKRLAAAVERAGILPAGVRLIG